MSIITFLITFEYHHFAPLPFHSPGIFEFIQKKVLTDPECMDLKKESTRTYNDSPYASSLNYLHSCISKFIIFIELFNYHVHVTNLPRSSHFFPLHHLSFYLLHPFPFFSLHLYSFVYLQGKKSKPKMGAGESVKFLAGSPYIRDLAALVVGYGMAINIVEVRLFVRSIQSYPPFS